MDKPGVLVDIVYSGRPCAVSSGRPNYSAAIFLANYRAFDGASLGMRTAVHVWEDSEVVDSA
jgi:hypothetical protein